MRQFVRRNVAAIGSTGKLMRKLAMLGAIFGALAVICGAFGAHALREVLDATALQTWHTAVEYQFWHALALLVASTTLSKERFAHAAGWLFVIGIVLFCGSLYALALGAARIVGAITPFGGLAMIAGWSVLAWSLLRSRSE
jgi:uncharacterized membrane protein YgdD (TMEM256/DUF423 family)